MDLSRIAFNEADKGIYRTSFSDSEVAVRRWLMQALETEGFQAEVDVGGNVDGRLGSNGKPTITLGSHLDTVPAGGMFDGALGVVPALEVLCRVKEANLDRNWPIELVATSEEEGRFGGMLGAQTIAGDLIPDVILNAHDADGNRLTDAMTAAGFDPLKVLDARRAPEPMRAWLEC